MTPERWQRIDHVFHAALERSEGERAAFVAEICAGDASLINDVEALLDDEGRARGRLQRVVGTALEQLRPTPVPERELEPTPVTYDASLRLAVGGLRFAEPSVEAAYRAWHARNAVAFVKLGMIVSIINWILAVIGMFIAMPSRGTVFAIWALGVMVPLCVTSIVLARFPRRQHWNAPLTMFVNCLTGCSLVVIGFELFELAAFSAFAVVIVSAFGFTIFRLRTAQAIAAVLPYAVLFQAYAVIDDRAGHVVLVVSSFASWIAFVSGIISCAVVDRLSRESYRQEQTIDTQRTALERERARVDVAERSRDLFAALSRLSAEPIATRLAPGDVVADRYLVIRRIGAGGMGEVHEVERRADQRRLALKVLAGTCSREALARLAREAQIAAQIDHPSVVNVIDVGVAPIGMFLVMELITGGTLASQRENFRDPRKALPLLGQIASALATMHELGIVHRDLKPANILLDRGCARVADFGIATRALDALAATLGGALTRTGMIVGTPMYMAPELADATRDARPSADIWSFGVIAHELLEGSAPFAEPPLFAALAGRPALVAQPLAMPDGPTRALLQRCLCHQPNERPTAKELADALPPN